MKHKNDNSHFRKGDESMTDKEMKEGYKDKNAKEIIYF
jgi:hypothetical protein